MKIPEIRYPNLPTQAGCAEEHLVSVNFLKKRVQLLLIRSMR